MSATTIDNVNSKLQSLPETLLKEVEIYIDFLSYKFKNENFEEIHQWQKDIVMERVDNPKVSVDAFEMLEELEK